MPTQLQETYTGKFSVAGWPLGRFPHRIGSIHRMYADDICRRLHRRCDGVRQEDVVHLGSGDSDYRDIIVHARLSMDRYSALLAFLEGYKCGLEA